MTPTVSVGAFNIQRGDLLNTDKIDVEWRQQSGNCPSKYPAESVDCTYTYRNAQGIKAEFIEKYNKSANFTTDNTFFLNVSVNHVPFDSCNMLQTKVEGHTLVTINQTGCVIG